MLSFKTFFLTESNAAPSQAEAKNILNREPKFKALVAEYLKLYQELIPLRGGGATYDIPFSVKNRLLDIMIDSAVQYIAYFNPDYPTKNESHKAGLQAVLAILKEDIEDMKKELKKLRK